MREFESDKKNLRNKIIGIKSTSTESDRNIFETKTV